MGGVSPAAVRKVLEKWILATGIPVVCDLDASSGAYLRDAVSGSDYLDFFSFFSSRPLGFNHEKLAEPAFAERLAKVARHKPTNCDVYTVEYAEFVDVFCNRALGGEFAHVFFIDGGSAAVENAVKAAIDWKHRKNLAAGRGEKGSRIVHFARAFHGRGGYALSLTDPFDTRKVQYFPTFDWPRVSNPIMSFPFDDAAKTLVEEAEAQSLAEIDAAFEKHPNDIAAIIIEPIQGEGGDNYFRSEFLRALRQLADDREVMLIFDEIQTGFGTTGEWWDYKHHGVKPDLLVFGKKTQVCGFAATDRIDEVEGVFKIVSRISSTFEGNLTDMVRCQRIIEIIEEDGLLSNAKSLGKYLLKVIGDLAQSHGQMTAVRGRGLWAAFDLPTTEEREKLLRASFDHHLLLIRCGERGLRMRPALDIDADAIGRAGAQLEAALHKVYPPGKKA